MKRITVFILLLFASSSLFSQTSQLTVFAEEGERFYLILNGEKYNDSPETSVKVMGITAGSYILKIIFEDNAIGELDKRLMIEASKSITCVIKKNRKGIYKIRYMGETVLINEPEIHPERRREENMQEEETVQISTNVGDPSHSTSNIGVSVNESTDGMSINMNVNINESHSNEAYSTSSDMEVNVNSGSHSPEPMGDAHYNMPGYSGPIGCPWPMSKDQFAQVQRSIDSKSFEDSKLIMARQVIASNCLLTSQVKRIMELFSFEDTRLELAKYAYGYTYDLGNYYQLNDAFDFESSIEELNEFILNN